LALEELEKNGNIVIKSNDIQVVLEQRIKDYLEIIPEITVNYRETWFDSGFVIEGVGSC
jgi:hypothetical protein